MIRENPDLKAYYTNIGYLPMLIFCDAQIVKDFLLASKKFRKFNLYKHSQLTYQLGMFLAEEEQWSKQRSIVKHSFNHENMKRMIPAMERSIDEFTNRYLEAIDKSQQKSV
jgi:cytochrome P450